jgi:hypothetical protein
VASERLTRQFGGRAARQGFVGVLAEVYDECEFDELNVVAARTSGVAAIPLLQKQRSLADQNKRRFADRLSTIKSFFLDKYVSYTQQENNPGVDLNRKWAACLSNMDIAWQHLIMQNYFKKKAVEAKVDETAVLTNCTLELIRKTLKDWNSLVSNDAYYMRPKQIEEIILQQNVNTKTAELTEVPYYSTLHINDVSAAKRYIDYSTLFVTLDIGDDTQKLSLQQFLDQKRIQLTFECLGQLFDEEFDQNQPIGSLQQAFSNLISKVFMGKPPIPYRKKLLEILAIGRWSKNEELQVKLSDMFLTCMAEFIYTKLFECKSLSETTDVSRTILNTALKPVQKIEALLELLRNTLKEQRELKEEEFKKMNVFESTLANLVTAYFGEDVLEVLDKLIAIADIPFTRQPDELVKALTDAESSVLYKDSWCVMFNSTRTNEKLLNAGEEVDANNPEHKPWSYVSV